jgi:hypothetical protein
MMPDTRDRVWRKAQRRAWRGTPAGRHQHTTRQETAMARLSDSWKLIDPMGGQEIDPGQTIIDFRDSAYVFRAITKAPGGNSGGKIQVGDDYGPEYYPSVFGLKIIARTPAPSEFSSLTDD